MININDNKEFVEFLANKHQTGASITPAQYNIAARSSLQDVVMYFYGLPQEYQPGLPMPKVAWEITQLVTDYLSHLKPTVTLPVTNSGIANKPIDYLHVSSISYIYVYPEEAGDPAVECEDDSTQQTTVAAKNTVVPKTIIRPVDIVDDAKWATLLSSVIRQPTLYYPACKFNDQEQVQFVPTNLGSVQFTYIRYPITPVWGYTTPDGFNPQYDAGTSVNIELPAILNNLMTYMVLTKLGINIREPQLQQYAELMKAKGL